PRETRRSHFCSKEPPSPWSAFIEPDRQWLERVRSLRRKRKAGRLSFAGCAARLQELGIATKSGRPWQPGGSRFPRGAAAGNDRERGRGCGARGAQRAERVLVCTFDRRGKTLERLPIHRRGLDRSRRRGLDEETASRVARSCADAGRARATTRAAGA